ncbi:MAG: phosphoglycerate kinase [Patescibacteria group bacterium]
MQYLRACKKGELKGKTVILRVDFNIEQKTDTFRIDASIPSIRFLMNAGARVLIMSHRGRPTPSSIKHGEFSLHITLPYLKKKLGTAPIFFSELHPEHIRTTISESPLGSVFILENLRFHPGEEENSSAFAKELASLGDIYVNDAFAASHRKHASVYALPKLLPSYAGIQLEREIETLDMIMKHPKKPLVLILGGAKAKDKIGVIRYFLYDAAAILLGGGVANTLLAARKFPIGDSVYDPTSLPFAKKMLREKKVILPIDFVRAENKLLDIGPLSTDLFVAALKGAKTIVWNGPLGLFERKKFARGSEEIAKALANHKGFTVAGGGETVSCIRSLKLENKFGFLSTGGGAMLEYMSGKELPGIAVLTKKK